MKATEVKKLYDAHPFRPFFTHLADGRKISVLHPEFMANDPTGRTLLVFQPDGSFDVIDLMLVTDLEVKATKTRE